VEDLRPSWAIAFCVIPITAHHIWLATATIWLAVALTLYTGWQYYYVR